MTELLLHALVCSGVTCRFPGIRWQIEICEVSVYGIHFGNSDRTTVETIDRAERIQDELFSSVDLFGR
jgi:hypothetical protein